MYIVQDILRFFSSLFALTFDVLREREILGVFGGVKGPFNLFTRTFPFTEKKSSCVSLEHEGGLSLGAAAKRVPFISIPFLQLRARYFVLPADDILLVLCWEMHFIRGVNLVQSAESVRLINEFSFLALPSQPFMFLSLSLLPII